MENKFKFIIVAVVAVVAIVIVMWPSLFPSNLIGKEVIQSQMSELKSIATNDTLANTVGIWKTNNPPLNASGSALNVDGKTAVVYVGADYCPYCAVTRWSLIIALMRFGNFTNLHYMQSSATDNPADVPTFTFYGSNYTGALAFQYAEIENRNGTPLQTPTQFESAGYTEEIPCVYYLYLTIK